MGRKLNHDKDKIVTPFDPHQHQARRLYQPLPYSFASKLATGTLDFRNEYRYTTLVPTTLTEATDKYSVIVNLTSTCDHIHREVHQSTQASPSSLEHLLKTCRELYNRSVLEPLREHCRIAKQSGQDLLINPRKRIGFLALLGFTKPIVLILNTDSLQRESANVQRLQLELDTLIDHYPSLNIKCLLQLLHRLKHHRCQDFIREKHRVVNLILLK